jgi:hypothetical protein
MSVKLKASYETEIYISQNGYAAIKQADPMGGDDTVVLLTSAQLPIVISELQAFYNDRASWESDGIERTDD